MSLATVKTLGRMEEGEVLMISKDLDGKWGAMEIMAPSLKSANNREKFTIVNIIIPFCGGKGLGEVGTGMPIAIGVRLEKDRARCIFRGIGGKSEGARGIGELQGRFGEEEGF